MATIPSKFEAMRGKCLDAAWVASVAGTLGVDPQARDSLQRRLYPWLNQALKKARFKINDQRQFLPTAYQPSCFASDEVMHGVGERVSAANGRQVEKGEFQGTFTLEWNGWPSHSLTSSVISILVQEVVGYDVTHFETGSGGPATQRMSGVRKGTCTPTHYNAEIWAASKLKVLNVYANESTAASNGYVGQPGWFTLASNVAEASKGPASTKGTFSRPYSADFWREYTFNSELVDFYSIQNANLTLLADKGACPDGSMGCLNGCSKSHACTLAEAQGKTCMIVAMMFGFFDPGYLQAAISNNNIPAYFCFSGYDGMEAAVTDVIEKNGAVTFYHCEPDLFHLKYEGKLQRIALPRAMPKIVATATGSFGENGYGGVTDNPVNVDFAPESLKKYFSNVLQQDPFLVNFLNKFQLTQVDINSLLKALVTIGTTESNPPFTAACNWVKANYNTWKTWLDPLPLCSFQSHMQHTVGGCDNSSAYRNVTFAWTTPDPSNARLPYQCEGGTAALPPPLLTSRSCDWLTGNVPVWSRWIENKPQCDITFYQYKITPCDAAAKREVKFSWLLPSTTDPTQSLECVGGVPLPPDTSVQCDYVPTESGAYSGMTAFAVIVLILLLGCIGLVVGFRGRPVIKRGQWPLLIVMLLGGICFCVYVLLGAGVPSTELCAGRPIAVVLGFTLTFGSLLVKGLRVYWIFTNKHMKKVTVSLAKTFKFLAIILGIDAVILVVWFVVDFPAATTSISKATEFVGEVDHINCKSSSFIFAALLIFWKTIVTFGGVYVSYLIRHVDSDFQESVWIFSSSCVVGVSSLVLLAISYLVTLPPAAAFTFESIIILFGTIIVMSLMLAPKFVKLNAADVKSSTGAGTTASHRESKGGSQTEVKPRSQAESHHKYEPTPSHAPSVQPIGEEE